MNERTPTQFILVFAEGLVLFASGAVLFVLIARTRGAELLGQYALVLAWLAAFQVLGNFGIPEFTMRETGAFTRDAGRYLGHGLIIGLSSSFAALITMLIVVHLVGYPLEIGRAIRLSSLALIPMIVTAVCRAGLLAHRKSEWIFLVALVESVVVVSINAFLVLRGHGIVALVLTIVCGRMLSSLLAFYFVSRYATRIQWQLDLAFCRRLLPPIFTFGVSTFLGVISMRLNIIVFSKLGTIYAVGLYAVANKVMEVALMVPNTYAQLMLPRLARRYATDGRLDPRRLQKDLTFLVALVIPIGFGVMLFAEPLLAVVFGEGYAESVLVLRILMIFFFVESADAVMGMVLKATGRQKVDVYMFTANPVVNTALNFLLIPSLGGVGVAVARLAGALCSSSLRYAFMAKSLVPINWARVAAKPFLICSVLVVCMMPLRGRVNIFVLVALFAAVSGALVYRIGGRAVRHSKGEVDHEGAGPDLNPPLEDRRMEQNKKNG